MPRRRTKSRRRRSRRGTARSAKRFKTRSARFSRALPRPIRGLKQLAFPGLCKTSLRCCFNVTLYPQWNQVQDCWQATCYFKCNGLNGPLVGLPGDPYNPTIPDPRVPLGLADYARIYTNYKVNSSKFDATFTAKPVASNYVADPLGAGDPVPQQGALGPAFITVRRRHEPTPLADLAAYSLSTCRENGMRFVKIDPTVAASAIFGTEGAGRQYGHRGNGASMTTGYLAKYAKPMNSGAGLEYITPHNSMINGDPNLLQYYQILLVQPDSFQIQKDYGGLLTPTPVNVMVTLTYKVSFWRKKTIDQLDTVAQVRTALLTGQQ